MITLGDLKGSLEKMKINSDSNIKDVYKCLFSILHEYSLINKEFLTINTDSYNLLNAFFGSRYDYIKEINDNNTIYFPLFMETYDDEVVLKFIENFVMYFTDNKEFVNKIFDKYKSYNFIAEYKKQMFEFIDNEFKNIIGLENIKEDLKNLVILITNNRIREINNLSQTNISMHMVFTGNPGTGKTTIARLIGQMYYKLGLIKLDNFVEVSRVDLVAEYVGQTATKTKKVLENAKGGILFIDEAYSLANSSENDYGKESIETILKFMEDNRDNTIIIVAGYENEMTNFINSNPGLKSRFNKYFKFNNYSQEELYKIFKKFANEGNYIIDSNEDLKIRKLFNKIDINAPDFSNARYVRNIFDRTVINQAKRVDSKTITDKEEFIKIIIDDVVL